MTEGASQLYAEHHSAKALRDLASLRDAGAKELRKKSAGPAKMLGWSARVDSRDTTDRNLARFRVEAAVAAGIGDETSNKRRTAFYRALDAGMAQGVGLASESAHVSPEMAAIDYGRVDKHRIDHIERQLGRRQAEADLLSGEDDEGDDFVDVAAALADDFSPPTADAGGLRSDGVRLAYRGTVTTFAGETGSGKTWAAMAFVVDEMRRLT